MQTIRKIGPNQEVVYNEKHFLGKGMYGSVYSGVLNKTQKVAVKKLNHGLLQLKQLCPNFQRQVECLKELDHPNIIKFYMCIDDEKQNVYYIISQLCRTVPLTKQIQAQKHFSQEKAFKLAHQIAKALFYMHFFNQRKQFMHRDLKPDNILISDSYDIKIGDFGLAKAIVGDDLDRLELHTPAGTPLYQAPNVIRRKEYSVKCDVWSAGLIYIQMLIGEHIFEQANTIESLKHLQQKIKSTLQQIIVKNKINKFWSHILNRMLVIDESIRADFKEIKETFDQQYERRIKQKNYQESLRRENQQKKVLSQQQIQYRNEELEQINLGTKKISLKPTIVAIKRKGIEEQIKKQPIINNFIQDKRINNVEENMGTNTALNKLYSEEQLQKHFAIATNSINYEKQLIELNYQIFNKLQDTTVIYPIQNVYKYILSFFLLGWYLHECIQFVKKHQQDQIKLYNGVILNIKDKINIKYLEIRQKYLKRMNSQINNVKVFMKTIQTKILSDYINRNQLKQLFEKQQNRCIKFIRLFNSKTQLLDSQLYQEKFQIIFIAYCKPNPIKYQQLNLIKKLGTMRLYTLMWLTLKKYVLFGDLPNRDGRDKILRWKQNIKKGFLDNLEEYIQTIKTLKKV